MFRQTASLQLVAPAWSSGGAVPVVAPWTTPGNPLFNATVDPTLVPGSVWDYGASYRVLALSFATAGACVLAITGDCVLLPAGAVAPSGTASGIFQRSALYLYNLPDTGGALASIQTQQTINGVLYNVCYQSVSSIRVLGAGIVQSLTVEPVVNNFMILGPVFPDVNITGQGAQLSISGWAMTDGGAPAAPTLDAYQMAVGVRDFGLDPQLPWMSLGAFNGNQIALSMPASCVFVRLFDSNHGVLPQTNTVTLSVLQQGSGS